MRVVILCGGLGTRLRSVVNGVPKTLAPINDRVFLDYLVYQFLALGFEKVILSTGYLSEKIRSHVENSSYRDQVDIIYEEAPMGTGGAIEFCLNSLPKGRYLFVNGDTFVPGLNKEFLDHLASSECDFSVVVRKMPKSTVGRFGLFDICIKESFSYDIDDDNADVFVSLGMYCVDSVSYLDSNDKVAPYSVDEFLRSIIEKGTFVNFVITDFQFIDIGVPEDYYNFIEEFG